MLRNFSLFMFWLSAGLLLYTWFIFPAILFFLSLTKNLDFKSSNGQGFFKSLPTVSVIVAALNEEKVIAQKIENLLEQDYPHDLLEIIVSSDGSNDRTVEIARKYEGEIVKVMDFSVNRGKALVHNDSANKATGDILFFTDAETIIENDFIRKSVQWFSDKSYGCGSGDYSFGYKDDIGKSENIYWTMEKTLRYWESKLGILPFASGGCFFLRRELYEPIPSHGDIDNILTLTTIAKGFKIFYAKDARAYDMAVEGGKSHFKKRVRTTLRSVGNMFSYLPLLFNAGKTKILIVLLSHRIIRWNTGFLMAFLWLSNAIIFFKKPTMAYFLLYSMQNIFYILVYYAYRLENQKKNTAFGSISKMAYSFSVANLASAIAIIKLIKGEKIISF